MMLKQLYVVCLAAAAVQLLAVAAAVAAAAVRARSEALCVCAAMCDWKAATCSERVSAFAQWSVYMCVTSCVIGAEQWRT
jgi:hypothetical protein